MSNIPLNSFYRLILPFFSLPRDETILLALQFDIYLGHFRRFWVQMRKKIETWKIRASDQRLESSRSPWEFPKKLETLRLESLTRPATTDNSLLQLLAASWRGNIILEQLITISTPASVSYFHAPAWKYPVARTVWYFHVSADFLFPRNLSGNSFNPVDMDVIVDWIAPWSTQCTCKCIGNTLY
jgi:hypothetical protein